VVRDIGEALVFKYVTDADQLPDEDKLAAIVDQAILPAIGIRLDRKTDKRPRNVTGITL
jgi:hypothetical protein